MTPVNLMPIAQYGVAIFSIGAILFIVVLFVKFIKDFMVKAVETQQELKDAVHEMLLYFKLKNGASRK